MAIRKNKKRIDPRYFLNETTYRDLEEAQQVPLNDPGAISQMFVGSKDPQTGDFPELQLTPNAFISPRFQANMYMIDYGTRAGGGNTMVIGKAPELMDAITMALKKLSAQGINATHGTIIPPTKRASTGLQ